MKSKERRSPGRSSRYDDYDRDSRRRRSRSRSYDRYRSRSPSYERHRRRSESPREWVCSLSDSLVQSFPPFFLLEYFFEKKKITSWFFLQLSWTNVRKRKKQEPRGRQVQLLSDAYQRLWFECVCLYLGCGLGFRSLLQWCEFVKA